MDESRASLTVYFEDPFWVGLYQREWNGQCQVCKITFGAEPKDYEVYQFLLDNWRRLSFSPPVATDRVEQRRINPKRMQRKIKKQLQSTGVGTKAQQALKLQQEAGKQARKVRSRAEKEAEQERKFAQRQEKRKAKHRGH